MGPTYSLFGLFFIHLFQTLCSSFELVLIEIENFKNKTLLFRLIFAFILNIGFEWSVLLMHSFSPFICEFQIFVCSLSLVSLLLSFKSLLYNIIHFRCLSFSKVRNKSIPPIQVKQHFLVCDPSFISIQLFFWISNSFLFVYMMSWSNLSHLA